MYCTVVTDDLYQKIMHTPGVVICTLIQHGNTLMITNQYRTQLKHNYITTVCTPHIGPWDAGYNQWPYMEIQRLLLNHTVHLHIIMVDAWSPPTCIHVHNNIHVIIIITKKLHSKEQRREIHCQRNHQTQRPVAVGPLRTWIHVHTTGKQRRGLVSA